MTVHTFTHSLMGDVITIYEERASELSCEKMKDLTEDILDLSKEQYDELFSLLEYSQYSDEFAILSVETSDDYNLTQCRFSGLDNDCHKLISLEHHLSDERYEENISPDFAHLIENGETESFDDEVIELWKKITPLANYSLRMQDWGSWSNRMKEEYPDDSGIYYIFKGDVINLNDLTYTKGKFYDINGRYYIVPSSDYGSLDYVTLVLTPKKKEIL